MPVHEKVLCSSEDKAGHKEGQSRDQSALLEHFLSTNVLGLEDLLPVRRDPALRQEHKFINNIARRLRVSRPWTEPGGSQISISKEEEWSAEYY